LPTATPTATVIPTQAAAAPTHSPNQGRPIAIQIPAIDIDTAIEPVGLTANHEIDAPRSWYQVGWYQYGSRPGQPGTAILVGHLDTNTGAPGIFWRLGELQPGDLIWVEGEGGQSLLFQIDTLVSYPYESAPLQEIYTSAGTPRLGLVTCSGKWNAQQQIYDHRLVVYAHVAEDSSSHAQ
jgi:sortase (surface protein transpeptidase)